jgi:hypothetical protein
VNAVRLPDNEWQRIWFSLRQHAWMSLALVPTDVGIDVLKVGETLSATGRLQGERPVTLIDATGVQLADVRDVIASIAAATDRGEWSIVPVDPIGENPSTIRVVQATSAALLVVRLGESRLTSAQGTIEAVGRVRFLGSLALDEAWNAVLR